MDEFTDETIIGNEQSTDTATQSNITFAPETDDSIPVNTENTAVVPEPAAPETEPAAAPETTPEPEDDYELVELDEQTAFNFLKEKKGLTIDNIDELLTPKEQKKYAPEMEKFNEFIEKTGNKDFNAFLETQKDWSAETDENVLKNYIKLSNPALTEKEVNHLYDKKYNTADLDEYDDESEILEKGINVKTDLTRAKEFLEKRKEEFSSAGGSDEYIPEAYREAKKFKEDHQRQEEAYAIERESKRNDFIAKTESLFNSDFEGFKIQLGDEKNGFEELTIKPDNLNAVKEFQLDSSNLIGKFLDENGAVKDPKGYHEAIYMANNYKAELNKAYQRGMAKQLENYDKLSKNIQPDNIRNATTNRSAGISFSPEK